MAEPDISKTIPENATGRAFPAAPPLPVESGEAAPTPNNRKILIVDDEKGIRKSLRLYLEGIGFAAEEARDGSEALGMLERDDFFLCLTDITMPGMSGIELLEHIKKTGRETDVVLITGHMEIDYAIEAIKQGAFDYFKKPFLFEDLKVTIRRVIEKQALRRKSIELERLKERRRIETKNLAEFMIALAGIIDAKSPFTRRHSERVSTYSTTIAELIGLDAGEVRRITLGAKLHDIGKIGTPESILDKPGPLTKEEFEVIKEHPTKGAYLIRPISSLKDLTDIVRYHHENLDGSGYPEGIEGDGIPLPARIVRIADYWDAITSKRPYRAPMPYDKARSVLGAEAGTKVDRELTQIFVVYLESRRS